MSNRRAVISLIVASGENADSPVLITAWEIDPSLADAFRQAATERFGGPAADGLSTIAATEMAGELAPLVLAEGT